MSRKEALEQGSLLLPRGPPMEGMIETPAAVDLANKLIKSTLGNRNLGNKVKLNVSEKNKKVNKNIKKGVNRNVVRNSYSKNVLSKRNESSKNKTPIVTPKVVVKPTKVEPVDSTKVESNRDSRDDEPPKKALWKPKIQGYTNISKNKYNVDDNKEAIDFDMKKNYGKEFNPSLRNNDNYKNKTDFSRLSGLTRNQREIFSERIGPNGPDLLTILKWHEERLHNYEVFKNDITKTLENIQNSISNLSRKSTYVNIDYHEKYNKSASVIIGFWRMYRLRKCIFAIKIQRYYRYWKNVKKMNSQILNVMQKLNKIKKQMGICGGYLSSFDPRKPLPLGELKDIHDRIKIGAEQLI